MTIDFTDIEYKTIIKGLLELPAKESLSIIMKLEETRNKTAAPKMATIAKDKE